MVMEALKLLSSPRLVLRPVPNLTLLCHNDSKSGKGEKLPEQPAECCMSGCANCVWLDYAEKLSRFFKDGGEEAIKQINEKVTDPNMKAFLLHELRMRKQK